MLQSFIFVGFLLLLLTTVYLYFELKNTKEKYAKIQKLQERQLFELSLLNEISDKIGYSLSSKDIAATIASTAEKIFPVTAVSYAIIEVDHIEITSVTHENLSPKFSDSVQQIMLTSIYNIDDELRKRSVSHKIAGITADGNQPIEATPASYFNVPLVLNSRFTGIITITSKESHAYQEADMSMLYKIVNKAQLALSRLENVIDQEKGKIDSLIKSLSSGEMFFTLKYDRLELFTINPAALRYLDITEENPDIIHVLSKFRLKPNIIAEMKDVIGQKKSTIYRNVEVGTSRFNIYVTPVFSKSLDSVIGVALTMQDVTREHETQKMREGFTNMMVHELRAPLTAIKGAADLLLDPKTEEDDKVKMRLIVRNSSERLLGEIDEMLDTARIDAGKLLVHKSESDINEVIEKVVSELSYIAQNRSILIEKHLDTKIPHVFLDPLRIGQVVTNLISNSIKYSDEHTVIDVFSRIVGEFVEIEVKDHGIGIDQDLIKSLFQPFAQGNFFKKAKGTGLGLYITKDIVTEHGGQIRIESEVGKGTSMFVKLPLKQEVSHQAQPAPSRLN
jgi:signal transduction histidine kinase